MASSARKTSPSPSSELPPVTGAAAARAASTRSPGHAGDKVTVGSKLPMAIELQLCEKRTTQMRNGQNSWTEDLWVKTGQIITINGTSYPNGTPPEGMPPRPMMAFGAALTPGVPKEFFDRWLEQNADQPMVRNGMIFAHLRAADVQAEARERVKDLSGLGPLTPDNDRRMPKKMTNKPGIRRDEAQKAQDDAALLDDLGDVD